MNSFIEFTLVAGIIVILPIIPSIIIFKTFPKSNANAAGPFKGIKIKLTGAFPGYFIIALLLFGLYEMKFSRPEKQDDLWTITGRVSAPEDLKATVRNTTISVAPPVSQVYDDDGNFVMSNMKIDDAMGEKGFSVIFTLEGCKTISVPIHVSAKDENNDRFTSTHKTRTLELKKPVDLPLDQ
jgi:hypothetical protein